MIKSGQEFYIQAIKLGITKGGCTWENLNTPTQEQWESLAMKATEIESGASVSSVGAVVSYWDGETPHPQSGQRCLLSWKFKGEYEEVFITYMGDGIGCYQRDNGMEYTFATTDVIFKSIEKHVEELACDAAEEVFGVMLVECRPDVSSTIKAMILANYRKEKGHG